MNSASQGLIQSDNQDVPRPARLEEFEPSLVDDVSAESDQSASQAISPERDRIAFLRDRTLEIVGLQERTPARRTFLLNDSGGRERTVGWPEGCAQPLVLAPFKDRVALLRPAGSVMEIVREANSVDAVTRLAVSGESAYVAITRDEDGDSTELWRYRCASPGKTIEVTRLPDTLLAPEVRATPQGAYVIDTMAPFNVAEPAGILHVPASGEGGVRASYPCPVGHRPTSLSSTAETGRIRVQCWSGGNASNSSVEVEM